MSNGKRVRGLSDPTQHEFPEKAEMPYYPNDEARVSPAEQTLRKYESNFLDIDGVMGMTIRHDQISNSVIVVYVRDTSIGGSLPSSVDGISVIIDLTGSIDAQ